MTLTVEYRVKFRVFGVTLGTVQGTTPPLVIPVSLPIPGLPYEKVLLNDRGVYIRASIA